jgi:hypothetical protein
LVYLNQQYFFQNFDLRKIEMEVIWGWWSTKRFREEKAYRVKVPGTQNLELMGANFPGENFDFEVFFFVPS